MLNRALRRVRELARHDCLVCLVTDGPGTDEATRRQVHIIQDHLRRLSEDFGRFRQRMDRLSVHISQAHEDVKQVSTSARKISSRFEDIDQVELPEAEADDKAVALPSDSPRR